MEAPGSAPSLMEVRLLAGCLVAFAGCDELVKLRCADITFNAEGKIESSKTDQYRDEASWVFCWAGDMPSWYHGALLSHERD